VLASNSFALLRTAARRGRGIALLPSNLVEDDLRAHRLIRVLPDVMHERLTLAVVYAERQFVSPAIRAFVAWMSAHAGATPGARARSSTRAG
jgi:DNA-binding transcriptional LysR family regulator